MEPSESKNILEMEYGSVLYKYDKYVSHRITQNYLTIKVLINQKEMMITAYVKSEEESKSNATDPTNNDTTRDAKDNWMARIWILDAIEGELSDSFDWKGFLVSYSKKDIAVVKIPEEDQNIDLSVEDSNVSLMNTSSIRETGDIIAVLESK